MPTDINSYITTAINYCFDETHGYQIGGNMNPDTDCSGLIWQSLHDNGFDVGASRFDTSTMEAVLLSAGFTRYQYTNSFTLEHGDIVMYNEYIDPQHYNGHAFIYAENVYAYTHSNASTGDGSTGTVAKARIEASSNRGRPAPGDQDNGYGCHPEVWSHTYTAPSSSHTWYVFRYQGQPGPGGNFDLLMYKKMKQKNFNGFFI